MDFKQRMFMVGLIRQQCEKRGEEWEQEGEIKAPGTCWEEIVAVQRRNKGSNLGQSRGSEE